MEQQAHGPGRQAVLVVEDEPQLLGALCRLLNAWGFTAHGVATGREGLHSWQQAPPQLVLLDLGLPDLDGLDVLHEARRSGLATPVLVLTARATISDRILGLNMGADAYLTKPFDFGELHARVLAALRHSRRALPGRPDGTAAEDELCLGNLRLHLPLGVAYANQERVALSSREFAFLRCLLERAGHVQLRAHLLQQVYADMDVREDALEVVAFRLRRKLARAGVRIVALRGLGYLIRPQP